MFRLISLFAILGIALFALQGCAQPTPTPVPTPTAPATSKPTDAPKPAAPTVSAPATSKPTDAPKPAAPTTASELKYDPKASATLYTFQVVPAESEVGYGVRELFFGQPAPQITRGSTKAIEGQFVAGVKDGKLVLQSSAFKVDLRTLKSDQGVRDQAIRSRWLESDKYPFAEFTLTNIDGLPPELKEGVETKFKASGTMKIREITKPATFEATATLNGNKLTGTATTSLLMKDFGFEPPDIAGRFTVSDGVTLTVKGLANLIAAK